MEYSLNAVLQQPGGTEGHPDALHGGHDRLYDVGTGLEYVGPHEVQDVVEHVLAAEPVHAQGHVPDGRRGNLPVDQVALHQRVFEEGNHRVYVVFSHLKKKVLNL